MGIQNGPAPEGRATGGDKGIFAGEIDRLIVQLAESERLRQEAFAACEIHRQEYEKLRLERDEWKAAAEYQQQQATQLRLQVAALEASLEDVQSINKTLAGQVQDKQRQSQVLMKERDDRTAQLQSAIDELRLVQLQMKDLTTARDAAFREIGELQQHRDELQAQLAAAIVTPAQQPDGTAERLEAVRRMIGEIWGWYACVECLGEQSAETWEQVGALLGHLQREAG